MFALASLHAGLCRRSWAILALCLLSPCRGAAAPGTRDPDPGNTAFMMAAFRGDAATVRLLLSQGANVNEYNRYGKTPLMFAAGLPAEWPLRAQYPGNPKVIRMLVASGAAVDARAANGNTALMEAAASGVCESVEILLAAGADVDAADLHGQTPLVRAARAGHEDIIKELLRHGAKVNGSHDINGETALMVAIQMAPSLSACLAEVRAGGIHETRYMMKVLWDSVRELLGLRAVTPSGIFERYLRIIALFLDRGADVNAVDRNGRTPLTLAAWSGHGRLVRLLLARGADVNATDRAMGGGTALMIGIRNIRIVEAILEKHPDLDRRDAFGKSALDYAVEDNDRYTADVLRRAGAH